MLEIKSIIEKAKSLLGEPTVNVEITYESFKDILDVAKSQWKTYSNASKIEENKLESMRDYWIECFFYALCKETLSMIRGKYDGDLPTPGIKLKLEYKRLLEESQKEKTRLLNLLTPIQDQILVAVYIAVKNADPKDIPDIVKKLSETIQIPGFTFLYLADPESTCSRIECIYPTFKVEEKIEKELILKLEKIINKIEYEKQD
jgi:hypothetical protein